MKSARSKTRQTIYAAIAGNLLVAITKFCAAFWTGSSAMLSEGIHSIVDTGNQVLLLYGEHRATRPADSLHPFGHGREIYFWSFVVALLLFSGGAGLSIYEGVTHILSPTPPRDPYVNYIVLGLSFAFEGVSWWIALKNFQPSMKGRSYWEAIRRSKDPPTFIVLLEDTAALIGLIIAFAGTSLAAYFELAILDGIASIAIGLVLASVSVILARESKSLLMGEPASSAFIAALRGAVEAESTIKRLIDIWTVHVGPSRIVATLRIELESGASAAGIVDSVQRLEERAKAAFDGDVVISLKPVKT
ncbi:MAG: cation diffusion facilitator family transporter [Aestuariivirga sp.]